MDEEEVGTEYEGNKSPHHDFLPEVPQDALPPLAHASHDERPTLQEDGPMPQLQMPPSKQELHRRALVPSVKANVMSGGPRRAQVRPPRPNRAPFLSIASAEGDGDRTQVSHGGGGPEVLEGIGEKDGGCEGRHANTSPEVLRLQSRLARVLQRRSDLSGRAPQGLAALLSPIPK